MKRAPAAELVNAERPDRPVPTSEHSPAEAPATLCIACAHYHGSVTAERNCLIVEVARMRSDLERIGNAALAARAKPQETRGRMHDR